MSSPPTLQPLVFLLVSKVSVTFRPLGETWSWDLVCFSWVVWCIVSSEQWRQNYLSMLVSWHWSSRQALWNQFMWFINWFMWPSLVLLPFYLLPTSILRELNQSCNSVSMWPGYLSATKGEASGWKTLTHHSRTPGSKSTFWKHVERTWVRKHCKQAPFPAMSYGSNPPPANTPGPVREADSGAVGPRTSPSSHIHPASHLPTAWLLCMDKRVLGTQR